MGYRGQVDKQNRARDLRAQGWTLTEICEEVGCSKASASLWCRDVELDQEVLEQRRRERFLDGQRGRSPTRPEQAPAAQGQPKIEDDARSEGSDAVGSV